MVEMFNALKKARFSKVVKAVRELSVGDNYELQEAIRLIRGFINNL